MLTIIFFLLSIVTGERADFILQEENERHNNKQYDITVETIKSCRTNSIRGSAILKYQMSNEPVDESIPIKAAHKIEMTTNPADKCHTSENICVTQVKALKAMPISLTKPRAQMTIYLPITQQILVSNVAGIIYSLSLL